MKKYVVLMLTILLFLAGCGSNNDDSSQAGEVPEIIEVTILTPDSLNPNEEVSLEAKVTQGDENVEDAAEVKFEVWKSGEDEREMLEAQHQSEGVYVVSKTFESEGVYNIVAHVTARDMHNMPKKEVTVGNPEAGADRHEEEGHHDESESEHSH
ncbi:FixH family protein [Mesobacillus campisalis]|uniref:FixH family protein n=1 Tax=Mesobacillus campisalis TaxID=1408103 RepID=UPI0006994DED|nr:FixH family protein [Mesobacillus campisalis]